MTSESYAFTTAPMMGLHIDLCACPVGDCIVIVYFDFHCDLSWRVVRRPAVDVARLHVL